MEFLKKNKFIIIGSIVGAIGGYAYYHFIGCASGSCAITSKPLNSSLYGSFMGGLLFSYLKTEKKSQLKSK